MHDVSPPKDKANFIIDPDRPVSICGASAGRSRKPRPFSTHCASSKEWTGLWSSIRRLDSWLEWNGWAGYDPYDVKGARLWLALTSGQGFARKIFRTALTRFEQRFPRLTRSMLRVRPQINAKAMGLLAHGYLDLYAVTNDDGYRRKAESCLEWLLEHPSPGYSGLCWGYPFDWQSKVFIPKLTPSAVVSSVVGQALWRASEVLGDDAYKKACRSICDFFLSDLNVDELDAERVCFSYTPLDDFHVHNANLFCAEFLARVGTAGGEKELLETAHKAAAYALSEQNPDGSLYYWGRVQNHYNPNHIDHYHSGFEIRALYGLWALTKRPEYCAAAKDYYAFYRENLLFFDGGAVIPKMTPANRHPIDIHSCAEAILCNCEIGHLVPQASDLALRVCQWTIAHMQNPDHSFAYMLHQRGKSTVRRDMPYMRWGQAWMLRGLGAVSLGDGQPSSHLRA